MRSRCTSATCVARSAGIGWRRCGARVTALRQPRRAAGHDRAGRGAAMIRWWRRRSLRARLVLIGTFGLAGGFLAGGLVLFAVLGLTLQRTVDDAALSTARDVATLAAA